MFCSRFVHFCGGGINAPFMRWVADSHFYALAAGERATGWVRVILLLRRPRGLLRRAGGLQAADSRFYALATGAPACRNGSVILLLRRAVILLR
jgi:hypothetical protein